MHCRLRCTSAATSMCFKTGDPAEGGLVSRRLYTLKGADPPESSDTAEAAEKLAEPSDGDGVHRLVMGLRKTAAAGGSQT